MGDVESEIASLKHALGVELDRELAKELGIDPSAVAAWRRRAKVPKRYVSRVAHLSSPHTFASALDAPPWRRSYLFALLTLVARGDDFSTSDHDEKDEFRLAFAGLRLAKTFDHLSNLLTDDMTFDDLRDRYATLKAEIIGEGVVPWVNRISHVLLEGPQ